MTVHFGANDSCSAGEPLHCSLADFKENIRKVVQWEGVRLHGTKVILVTPSPVEEYRLPNDGAGREEDVPVVDLWGPMMRTATTAIGGWKVGVEAGLPGSASVQPSVELGRLLYDGLHLTRDGYEIYTSELVSVLEREVPERQVDGTAEWYPEWVRFHPPRG